MSPLSVGLAEVDQRLRSLRRRLNDFTLLHTLCLVLSALTFVSAALILLAMLASADAFRMGVVGACALIATVLVTAGVYLRRQWLDLSAAAWVVDRRAALTDRLTTLAALHAQPRPSRLLPILVKQTLALGSRWQPRHIQPRRVPRSAFVLLVALLALASTGFVSRHIPPPPPPSEIAPQAPPQPVRGPQNEPPQSSKPQRKSPEQGGQPVAADAPELSDDAELDAADGESGKSRDGRGGDHGRPLSIAALPDRLQQAIRQTFKAEPVDQARPLGGGSQADMEGGKPQPDSRPSTDPDAEARQPGHPRSRDESGTGGMQKGQSQTGKPGDQDGKSQNPGGTEQQQNAASPGAGGGSSPSGLMGPEGMEPVLGSAGPKTFKLTITSFLRGGMNQSKSERQGGGKRVATTGKASPAANTALSDHQLGDDLLRKAEIPPEYEDIVRRVYSVRASR